MEVRCDKCQARYKVDDARIGPQGLTMRCGKCQNTFKVMRPAAEPAPTVPDQSRVPPAAPKPAAPAPAAPAAKPAPKPAGGEVGATMVFGQSPVAAAKAPPAAKPSTPAPAAKPAAATKPTPAAAPAEEGAGRTMMFQTGNIKTSPAPKKPEPESGATMVFGQSPLAAPKAAAAPAVPKAKPEPESGATMVFGQSPIAAPKPAAPAAAKAPTAPAMNKTPAAMPKPAPAPAKPEPVPEPAAEPEAAPEPEAAAPEAPAEAEAPAAADAEAETPPAGEEAVAAETSELPPPEAPEDSGVEAEGAEGMPEEGAFDKAPPKGLLIGVAAGLAVLLLIGGGLVMWKKLGHHPPPPAALETLAAAQADADKDTLISLATAEGKAKDAIDVAGPKSKFPEAVATLARIEVQWADALNDQAALLTQKDANDAKAPGMQDTAKTKLKAAFELLSPAIKADPKSQDLALALADYYRAQKSNSNMNKFIRSSGAKPDDPRILLVQALAAAQEDDGAEKAVPKLKAVVAVSPQSARLHFRLAEEYAQVKDDANTRAEIQQTLKLSPQHERAKLLMDQLGPQSAAEQK